MKIHLTSEQVKEEILATLKWAQPVKAIVLFDLLRHLREEAVKETIAGLLNDEVIELNHQRYLHLSGWSWSTTGPNAGEG